METMNIAIPDSLKSYVQERVQSQGYSSASEYIRDLIRRDQKQTAQSNLETELLKGLASGPPESMAARDWEDLRRRVRRSFGRTSG